MACRLGPLILLMLNLLFVYLILDFRHVIGVKGFDIYGDLSHSFWIGHFWLNTFLVLPSFLQHRHFTMMLAFVIIWNICIWIKLFWIQMELLPLYMGSQLSWLAFITEISFGILMNTLHAELIMDSIILQFECLGYREEE